ncbi:hypothetical protein AVEN_206580-1 [Araneus ventricosus]|uniref:Uncharacterized protein n=1 Tax=Araneus ventricosus TaxID=182803 RepID=A0A4Y2W994_ARAVE|nr:hypothetical protein AVEN_206580-1 [Araneus ventricosus]
MRCASAKFGPKLLSSDPKEDRLSAALDLFESAENDVIVLRSLSTSGSDIEITHVKKEERDSSSETYSYEVQKSKRLRGEEYISIRKGFTVPAKSNNTCLLL